MNVDSTQNSNYISKILTRIIEKAPLITEELILRRYEIDNKVIGNTCN